jgi:hypothetical protein
LRIESLPVSPSKIGDCPFYFRHPGKAAQQAVRSELNLAPCRVMGVEPPETLLEF